MEVGRNGTDLGAESGDFRIPPVGVSGLTAEPNL